jgi:hypothetical protein
MTRQFNNQYLFTNPEARNKHKRYTPDVLKRILNNALEKCGEPPMKVYAFTKYSGFTQLAVEHGLNDAELQLAGGHARIESVRQYRALVMSSRKKLLEGKPAEVVPITVSARIRWVRARNKASGLTLLKPAARVIWFVSPPLTSRYQY